MAEQENDRRIVEASRALLYDTATVLHDLARRSPPMFAARVRLLIIEIEDTARDLERWDQLPDAYADPPPGAPPDR
jgi:hypothetical protein